MKGHGWDNPGIEEALVELYKGKITSKEENYSGEGIFFSAKMLDEFILWSDSCIYKSGADRKSESIQSHLLSYASRMEKIGTMVLMRLENETERKLIEVFTMYADVDEGFVRTRIPVKEACINGEPVARSQARRICNRLEVFKEVRKMCAWIMPYWANTSSNSLVGKLIREGGRGVKESFQSLMQGEHLIVPIDEQIVYDQLDNNENAIWSLLVASGYLKALFLGDGMTIRSILK